MHQIITKPNQNICCLPVIDIEEKTDVLNKDKTIKDPASDIMPEVSKKEENETDTILEERQSFIP